MNGSEHSASISLEQQVLGYMMNHGFYDRVKNIVTRDMFEGRYATLFDTITYGHKNYDTNLSREQLTALFVDRNPAMPQSTKGEVVDIVSNLSPYVSDSGDLEYDVVKNFWVRDRARRIQGRDC